MAEQRELDFEPWKLRRNQDPDTSHGAAESAKELRSRHHRIILDALADYGPLTSEEIASVTPLEHAQAWRRMGELRDARAVEDNGERRRNKSNRLAIVWQRHGR